MSKVVYNACFGGFGLSYAAVMRYAELSGVPLYGFTNARLSDRSISFEKYTPVTEETAEDAFCIHYRKKPSMENDASDESSYWNDSDLSRTDPILIQVVEELGVIANGQCAQLAIEEISKGEQYRIDEYDGRESVMRPSDYQWEVAP